MASRLSLFCSRVIEVGWLLIVAAIPLFFNPWTHNVFELNKVALFRCLVLAMLLAWIIKGVEEGGLPISSTSPSG